MDTQIEMDVTNRGLAKNITKLFRQVAGEGVSLNAYPVISTTFRKDAPPEDRHEVGLTVAYNPGENVSHRFHYLSQQQAKEVYRALKLALDSKIKFERTPS